MRTFAPLGHKVRVLREPEKGRDLLEDQVSRRATEGVHIPDPDHALGFDQGGAGLREAGHERSKFAAARARARGAAHRRAAHHQESITRWREEPSSSIRTSSSSAAAFGGCGAAYESRYWGRDLKIVLVEKANVERSGAVAQGLSAINCYMGMQWGENQPEDFVRYSRGDSDGSGARGPRLRHRAPRRLHRAQIRGVGPADSEEPCRPGAICAKASGRS